MVREAAVIVLVFLISTIPGYADVTLSMSGWTTLPRVQIAKETPQTARMTQ